MPDVIGGQAPAGGQRACSPRLGLTGRPEIIVREQPRSCPRAPSSAPTRPRAPAVEAGRRRSRSSMSAGPDTRSGPRRRGPVAGRRHSRCSRATPYEFVGHRPAQRPATPSPPARPSAPTRPSAELATKGSPITLYVSSGPAQVKVPPVEGLTEAQAERKLIDLGPRSPTSPSRTCPPATPTTAGSSPRHRRRAPTSPPGTVGQAEGRQGRRRRRPPPRPPRPRRRPPRPRRPRRPPPRSPDHDDHVAVTAVTTARRRVRRSARRRKLRSRSWPAPVRMLSGWNCTPSIGQRRGGARPSRCRRTSAVTSRQSGIVAGSITRLW